MYITWRESKNFNIEIDGIRVCLKENRIDLTLENGWHHFEVRHAQCTKKEIIRLIIRNWFSCLMTSMPTYSIDNAFEDSCDQVVTFDLLVNEAAHTMTLNVENPSSHFIINNYSKEKRVNPKLLSAVKRLYLVPMTILLFMVSGVFLWCGFVSLKSNGAGIAYFSICLGSCFFALIPVFLCKIIKDFRKLKK